MKYRVMSRGQLAIREADDGKGVEAAINELKGVSRQFVVGWDLPFTISAFVERQDGAPDNIIIKNKDYRQIAKVVRDTLGRPGPFGASCDSRLQVSVVPAESLIVEFRAYGDAFTDRDTVWVVPKHDLLYFIIKSEALETEGLIAQIVSEAEKTVEEKLLSLFK